MTTVVISASPGPLLEPLIASLGEVERWSPTSAPAWLTRLPGAIGRFAQRRVSPVRHPSTPGTGSRPDSGRDRDLGSLGPRNLSPVRDPDGVVVRDSAMVLGIEAVLRGVAGARTDRRYRAEFAVRAAIDGWAAREVRARRPAVVVAPSLAARRTFAAARAVGAKTVLVMDLPLLRALHRDLDRAAERWPERVFLRRFRAPSWAIARQEAERVLADEILVRGAYAQAMCLADGIAEARLGRLPAPPPRVIVAPANATGRVRLAGLAAARHGVDTALAMTRALGLTLVVRTGEGTEPRGLERMEGVATDDGPVDAIVCPAVCETYAPELRVSGVPVVASPPAGGDGPGPFDVTAWVEALSHLPRDPRSRVTATG